MPRTWFLTVGNASRVVRMMRPRWRTVKCTCWLGSSVPCSLPWLGIRH